MTYSFCRPGLWPHCPWHGGNRTKTCSLGQNSCNPANLLPWNQNIVKGYSLYKHISNSSLLIKATLTGGIIFIWINHLFEMVHGNMGRGNSIISCTFVKLGWFQNHLHQYKASLSKIYIISSQLVNKIFNSGGHFTIFEVLSCYTLFNKPIFSFIYIDFFSCLN